MTTIHRSTAVLALAFVLVAGLLAAPAARAADETPFAKMAEHYEVIWRSLAGDSVDGVAEHARAIAETAEEGDHPAEARDAVPEIAEQAGKLAAADGIDAARAAFGDLTKPLVRYRKAVGAELLKVAYCPMAKKAWLQPDGEIGNPYYGSEMLTCGSFVGS
jgi:Cu(I)/Ag(I) efflux system membrane fusion protein